MPGAGRLRNSGSDTGSPSDFPFLDCLQLATRVHGTNRKKTGSNKPEYPTEWQIAVHSKRMAAEELRLQREIKELGGHLVRRVSIRRLYFLQGHLTTEQVSRLAQEIFADPVTEYYQVEPLTRHAARNPNEIVILYNSGVTDPSEASIRRAVTEALSVDSHSNLNIQIRTGRAYRIYGDLTRAQIVSLAERLLYNPLIQHIAQPDETMFATVPDYQFRLTTIELLTCNSQQLMALSRSRQLALNRCEMLAIKRYYRRLGRNPTDIELETFAQTWSEHCKHKTFRGKIIFTDEQGHVQMIDDLFRQTIYRVTKELNRPWCLSVFRDNSGVIAFDRKFGISFKVETHNHPSALEPYGGAATGIGGVIRDCLGTGLGAKPILNTNVFCFAPPDLPAQQIPEGVLHPQRILKGVVAGVRDYGNRMGIPTANGAIYFHSDFRCNPLVFCGTVGIIPRNRLRKRVAAGDIIVLLGARTGRDGIHGVTFASLKLTHSSETVSQSAVQIGNPIEEKKLADVILQARDRQLFNAITDCGGGGLSSAIGELVEHHGAVVDLDLVPLKYQGLSYTEIWISESQERQVLLVAPDKLDRLLKLCRAADVEATAIGRVTDNRRLILRFQGHEVADIDLHFLHHGWGLQTRRAVYRRRRFPEPVLPLRRDYTEELLSLLSSPNIASKEWVIRQYDHEVQGMSVIKPLIGTNPPGPSDGCVIKPLPDSPRGVVIACGLNPRYGLIDPYNMAASAIDEALRNAVACGGDPERTALLDNFCWGSPENPSQLGKFVAAAHACYQTAKGFRTPFISGKDSFYNEFATEDGKLHPIPPTLLVSAVSIIPDCNRVVTMDLKQPDSLLFLLGRTYDELGGSEYYARQGYLGNSVPAVRPRQAKTLMIQLHRAIRAGVVAACHDLSEGGLAVAIAEMAFAGGIGVDIRLPGKLRADQQLFSESNSRFLVEVRPDDMQRFCRLMASVPCQHVGFTRRRAELRIFCADQCVAHARLDNLESAWRTGLTSRL